MDVAIGTPFDNGEPTRSDCGTSIQAKRADNASAVWRASGCQRTSPDCNAVHCRTDALIVCARPKMHNDTFNLMQQKQAIRGAVRC